MFSKRSTRAPWLASTSWAACYKVRCRNGLSTSIKEGPHREEDPNTSEDHACRREHLQDCVNVDTGSVTVSPSPQSKDEENEKLHKLREYARDFRRQHTTDAEQFDWDSDDGDYGLAIGRLVVT
jgi:hypothetical protein